MRHRDLRQPREFPIAELGILALQDASRCRPAQPLVRAVHLRQQRDVGRHFFDPDVHLRAALRAELDPRAGLQKLVDL